VPLAPGHRNGSSVNHKARLPVILLGLAGPLVLAGCSNRGEIDATGGIVEVRSACPIVAIPAHTGDVTLFNPVGSTDARAIDLVASMTDLRHSCDSSGAQIYSTATVRVDAVRKDVSAAREVTVPYFSTVVRGATAVVAKRVGQVRLSFAPGQNRASATVTASSYVDKATATLPREVEQQLTRKRKAGDADAAVDPLSRPEVRAAVQASSFELLVGFNLTQDQLRYNVTR
jgi:hypothetical protein